MTDQLIVDTFVGVFGFTMIMWALSYFVVTARSVSDINIGGFMIVIRSIISGGIMFSGLKLVLVVM